MQLLHRRAMPPPPQTKGGLGLELHICVQPQRTLRTFRWEGENHHQLYRTYNGEQSGDTKAKRLLWYFDSGP